MGDTAFTVQKGNHGHTGSTDGGSLPIDTIYIYYNNGTSTRSTVTSTRTTIPGATGDTSYTAPADRDVSLYLTFHHMVMKSSTSGVLYVNLEIDGTYLQPGTYKSTYAGWSVETCSYIVEVNAGDTVDIDSSWLCSSGTGTITNDNSGDEPFPTQITGIVVPR